jgi:hypothetical protein
MTSSEKLSGSIRAAGPVGDGTVHRRVERPPNRIKS